MSRSLSPEDNDPVLFFSYLIAALRTVHSHLGTTALSLLRTPQSPPPETVMTLLVNDFNGRRATARVARGQATSSTHLFVRTMQMYR
jgi:ATP/maltotriose-dependent transcriptional regulator MalT